MMLALIGQDQDFALWSILIALAGISTGISTGTYIGGGLNFAAVAEASGMQDGSMLAAAVAADNIVTNLHFLLIIFLPGVA